MVLTSERVKTFGNWKEGLEIVRTGNCSVRIEKQRKFKYDENSGFGNAGYLRFSIE